MESSKIKNAIFPYKTALSEGNVKTNRIRSTKWTTKNGVLPVTTLLFQKFRFVLRTSYEELN